MTYYRNAKWEGEPKESRALCPKCNSPDTEVIASYPVDCTELYKDYKCKKCGHEFTINWS